MPRHGWRQRLWSAAASSTSSGPCLCTAVIGSSSTSTSGGLPHREKTKGQILMTEFNRRELLQLSAVGALTLQAIAPAAPRAGRSDGLQRKRTGFSVPPDYLREPEHIPDFWVSTYADVERFLDGRVRKGTVREVGRSAGGRPIQAVVYGRPRAGEGTTTFSGALGYGDVRA